MSFGQVLESVRLSRGETQKGPAKVAHVSSATVSKYEIGTRRPNDETMKKLVEHYDSPELCMEASIDYNGGTSSPWLNGADLHKTSVHLKTIEEISEAVAALAATPITKRRDQLNTDDLKLIKVSIMEQIEAITALTHNVAILCKEYGFSWMGLWREHRQELKMKGYLN
ncbi:transcriptional regulator with XRE-family HTH domain [Paenibacillus sp. V4I3]|uniref:helix-turn-helix domain-containing protein n=1 Tax=Paenibacillus sp. V4I3 TaxID=3042305 RepID=UPI002783C324|nr:helix-turn-helix transcriptional regulator [Paenibacillus sp. V4I3]MDQ0876790.1 transcriptional regulator with XRE-family HTH domain [Paenibacillus sp. V4I3]